MQGLQERLRWNHRYSQVGFTPDWAPDMRLVTHLADLPEGQVLELACGVGANALFLAKRGRTVCALDISDVALESLRRAASAEGVLHLIDLQLVDLSGWRAPEGTHEVVVCTRFLDRSLCPKLERALKPGGVLFYRSFSRAHLETHPEFPEDYCLEEGELPTLFPGLLTMHYEETQDDEGSFACLLAQRPE